MLVLFQRTCKSAITNFIKLIYIHNQINVLFQTLKSYFHMFQTNFQLLCLVSKLIFELPKITLGVFLVKNSLRIQFRKIFENASES